MNTRIFVQKKEAFRTEGILLCQELKESLGLDEEFSLKRYNIYDIFNADENDIRLLKENVCSEVVTDKVYDDIDLTGKKYLAYEYLPGQYDQRADSAMQCLMLLNNKQSVRIHSGTLLLFENVTDEQIGAIEHYLINPVESRVKDLSVLEDDIDINVEDVPVLTGFNEMDKKALSDYREELGLAMSQEDIEFVQDYFKNTEHRDPTMTEIRVLDTYWSDHCRHTTFETILKNIKFHDGQFNEQLQKAYETYLNMRKELGREEKEQTLMDMATIGGKYLKAKGKLENLEKSDEINACSIEIKVDVDGEDQDWLLMFKNETHNHPTEIEPFGGAATCIGGAIRDPLSGRSYVYQAMRITGAGDITKPVSETMEHKLPQSKISQEAAHGYSSYGNQIGLATTYVEEIYDEGYVAKRLEVGGVVGAAPKANVIREHAEPGDIIVLLGGATGRDGIGGATGSSKEHNESSLEKCSSEVQKGNALIERKLQRLFRNPECTRLIKICNDFGAGGVSVAVGELADGLDIDLDVVPVKYLGLDGTELAISESQERMAVCIEAKDFDHFLQLAHDENLNAVKVADVTDTNRLVMKWRGKTIVDMSRDFLNTNGVRQIQDVDVTESEYNVDPFAPSNTNMTEMLQQPNVASQIGLSEMFDASIGKSTVLMPWGGKYQLTQEEGSVQKLPVHGFTNTCSLMTYGYDPQLSKYSPYLGASYSVVEALARLTALGADYKTARLSNQEYFEHLGKDEKKWGNPFQALLGLIEAQLAFETPAIGGKDSMSGTYNDIHVPPTVITFAVTTAKTDDIVSASFKKAGNYIYLVKHEPGKNHAPNYEQLKSNFDAVHKYMKNGKIISAGTIKFGGLAYTLCRMAFGNKIGAAIKTDEDLFGFNIGSMIVETTETIQDEHFTMLGMTNNESEITINDNDPIKLHDAIEVWQKRYDKIYPAVTDRKGKAVKTELYNAEVPQSELLIEKPIVVIPIFPGQNCEYDTTQKFERAGAEVHQIVFNNLTVEDIQKSIDTLAAEIRQAQILMLVGGFSSGDEPDGSGKFIANVLRNKTIAEAIDTMRGNDGLILGICNGFQALIKSGLLPYGDIEKLDEHNPTLFRNNINRHVSHIANTRITSNKSPWLTGMSPGTMYSVAVSHGEGKFVAEESVLQKLAENGQIATQYVNEFGVPTMNGKDNINGSYWAIEGILSEDGKIFGKMGHSERYEPGLFQNISGNKDQNIFANGVKYFTHK
ncbi:phosphoribosylformylglycinamidine synthase [Catenisphaera adipataccumulans]|uniref:Phosphoribosylformylglycinamidine synthase n=1 Tax=Catenisphaera adipataccumulans TaxID=700500 RepID=A0A7W8CXX1_9FIRM|nr:phosphoribosylformylglycinamidine synthase [Catenisphaera adipataccumulans]MBB5182434.1 phosphoribosylformylglycinamidine synthase [Catenisphaera adipataccumulans]